MSGYSVCTLPFSSPCNDMLAMFVCATRCLSMHFYTLAYMSMHESYLLVCRPCFNTYGHPIQTYICPLRTPPLFICYLALFPFFACILVSMFAMSIMFIYFMPLYCALCIFSFDGFFVGFLSFPLHVRTWSKDAWSYGTVSQVQAKGARI